MNEGPSRQPGLLMRLGAELAVVEAQREPE